MATAEVGGVRIEYDTRGDPAAPAILLLMGLGMQLIAWPEAFCDALVAGGFRVVRLDNRDCGLSSKLDHLGSPNLLLAYLKHRLGMRIKAGYALDDMARDAIGVLDALGIQRAHLVGVSMGGMIAQTCAARHPDRVASLTSIMSSTGNPRLPGPTRPARRALLVPPRNPRDLACVTEHLIGVFRTIGSPGFPTSDAERRARVEASVRRCYHRPGIARQLVAVVASGDRRRELASVTAPTLVIHGDSDPLVPAEAGRDTARSIPGATLRIIEGMGHDLAPGLVPILAREILAHCRGA